MIEFNDPTVEIGYDTDKEQHVCKVYEREPNDLDNAFEVNGYGDTVFTSLRRAVEQVKSISE